MKITLPLFVCYSLKKENCELNTQNNVKTEDDIKKSNNPTDISKEYPVSDEMMRDVAHNIDNIITPIIGLIDRVKSEKPEDNCSLEHLEVVSQAARRAKEQVARILRSRSTETHHEQIRGVRALIHEVLDLLRLSLPSSIAIQHHYDVRSDIVKAEPIEIYQVILNVLSNALYSMRFSGGVLTVTLTNLYIEGGSESHHPNLGTGYYLKLLVKDTGCGMNSDTLQKAFDPFFTTKEEAEGAGLGLTIARKLIRKNNGDISIESREGNGTAVCMYWPLADLSNG
jgi:signal transduction histidine kinase